MAIKVNQGILWIPPVRKIDNLKIILRSSESCATANISMTAARGSSENLMQKITTEWRNGNERSNR